MGKLNHWHQYKAKGDGYVCTVYGVRIPPSQIQYALKNGAKLVKLPSSRIEKENSEKGPYDIELVSDDE